LKRVDLAVVAKDAKGLGKGPFRQGIGREALMKNAKGRFKIFIRKVGIKPVELGRNEQALVQYRF
jgi:hypothetical protein